MSEKKGENMLQDLNPKKLAMTSLTLAALTFASCSGGGGGGGGGGTGTGGSTYGQYSSPTITANRFITALNDVDGLPADDLSELILTIDETERSQLAGQDDWFVIYDSKYDEYKAVSLQYVRSIVYYDYYSNDFSAADEFRNIETDDILDGYINGDYLGDDYEVVTLGTDGFFYGEESGYAYEDESETTDVNLMAADSEKMKFFKQASNVSYTYSVSLETAMSLVTLGSKVESMLKKSDSELTAEDQAALMGDIENLTGVTLEEVVQAGFDNKKKEEVLEKISSKVGTTAQHLEGELLPELFGVQI
jgi:hypothetical protein